MQPTIIKKLIQKGYDFQSDFFTDEIKTLIEDTIEATIEVCSKEKENNDYNS